MSKSTDECSKCKFWNDWGLPIIFVLVFGLITLGYFAFSYNIDNQACLSVFNQTVFEKNQLAKNLSVCKAINDKVNIDEIFSENNVFNFCQSKGFESGGYSSYSCKGVMCITSNIVNATMVTKTGCYDFSELIAYVR